MGLIYKINYYHYPLQKIAHKGSIIIFDYFLKLGFDINSKDFYNWTPLHEAVFKGKKKLVIFLIENGADINSKANI